MNLFRLDSYIVLLFNTRKILFFEFVLKNNSETTPLKHDFPVSGKLVELSLSGYIQFANR